MNKLSFLVHNFMDACSLEKPTKDGPISMCLHNALRDNFVCHLAGTSSGTCLALPEPDRTQSLVTSLSLAATRARLAHHNHGGRTALAGTAVLEKGPTEILPAVGVMLTSPVRLCRPCRLAGPAHAAATAGFLDTGRRNLARDGLFAGGNRIRTIGSAGGGRHHRNIGSRSRRPVRV